MPTSNRLVFPRSLTSDSVTSRTAVYGPVRTVVWQGSVGDRRPYADLVGKGLPISMSARRQIKRDLWVRMWLTVDSDVNDDLIVLVKAVAQEYHDAGHQQSRSSSYVYG